MTSHAAIEMLNQQQQYSKLKAGKVDYFHTHAACTCSLLMAGYSTSMENIFQYLRNASNPSISLIREFLEMQQKEFNEKIEMLDRYLSGGAESFSELVAFLDLLNNALLQHLKTSESADDLGVQQVELNGQIVNVTSGNGTCSSTSATIVEISQPRTSEDPVDRQTRKKDAPSCDLVSGKKLDDFAMEEIDDGPSANLRSRNKAIDPFASAVKTKCHLKQVKVHPLVIDFATSCQLDNGRWKCPSCPKDFSSEDHLCTHFRIHTGERPYICQSCGKAYTRGKSLWEHQLRNRSCCPSITQAKGVCNGPIHDPKFKCQLCLKSFFNKSALTAHLGNHAGVKPFSCHKCEKSYFYKRGLQRHLVIHTGGKLSPCQYCGKGFIRKDQARLHEKLRCKKRPSNNE